MPSVLNKLDNDRISAIDAEFSSRHGLNKEDNNENNNNNNNLHLRLSVNDLEDASAQKIPSISASQILSESIVGDNYASIDSTHRAEAEQTQVYFKRWLVLFSFCLISLLNAFNWIEYSIIQDVVIEFYNQSLPSGEAEKYDAVNWFSMVYMLCYIPLVFPAMFLLDRKGLKLSCMLGALLTTVGAGVKCAGVNPNLFAVAMTGQTICAIAQAFTLSVPARLSALWFGPQEIATATSIGVFGNQLGTAIGFLVPPNVVLKSESVSFMQTRFYYLLVPVAVLCAISFLIATIGKSI
jgi:hypothetical protein